MGASLGVDIENLLVSQPDTGEMALEIVDQLIRSAAVDLVVVDSVAALTPRSEIEGEMGDHSVGAQASNESSNEKNYWKYWQVWLHSYFLKSTTSKKWYYIW